MLFLRLLQWTLLSLLWLLSLVNGWSVSRGPSTRSLLSSFSTTRLFATDRNREAEIRRKIVALKKAGRIQNKKEEFDEDDELEDLEGELSDLEKLKRQRQALKKSRRDSDDKYSGMLKSKLGSKATYLGLETSDSGNSDSDEEPEEDEEEEKGPVGRLGSLPKDEDTLSSTETTTSGYKRQASSFETTEFNILNPTLFEDDEEDDEEEPELSEEDLVDLVAQKLQEKRDLAKKEEEARLQEISRKRNEARLKEAQEAAETSSLLSSTPPSQTTSGVGGSWSKNKTAEVETYQPKSGSWGAFPRPKDISKTYGGGRRVGAGFDKTSLLKSVKETEERLQQYREKVGIEVQSEKDHMAEIEQALGSAQYSMQRGMYSSAVSKLELVTKWCSTNSKLGGKVFLELGMAYEAEGRTGEAVTVYKTLTKCRIEDIKDNAKRLLYGIEAMQIMRDEVKSKDFSRKKIRNTFIDTTGLANIAENFDDVYQTAYIDLEGGFYRRLTENVVRGSREARQILLKATGSGEVDRMKVVQALRSLGRSFDTALDDELKRNAPAKKTVAVMDGKPILAQEELSVETMTASMDEFYLATPLEMMENLSGEWKLQLLADKRGDGVKYFNNSLSWQSIDTDEMSFKSSEPAAFLTLSQSGQVDFNKERRILTKKAVKVQGGGMLSMFMKSDKVGPAAPQQFISVDSVLLITRAAPTKKPSPGSPDDIKDFFAVWRRVEDGTYSSPKR